VTTVENRLQGGACLFMIGRCTFQGIALAQELIDVTTRCLLTVATQHDTAHLLVARQLAEHCSQGPPHRQVERIAFARIGQRDGRDGSLTRAEDAAGHATHS